MNNTINSYQNLPQLPSFQYTQMSQQPMHQVTAQPTQQYYTPQQIQILNPLNQSNSQQQNFCNSTISNNQLSQVIFLQNNNRVVNPQIIKPISTIACNSNPQQSNQVQTQSYLVQRPAYVNQQFQQLSVRQPQSQTQHFSCGNMSDRQVNIINSQPSHTNFTLQQLSSLQMPSPQMNMNSQMNSQFKFPLHYSLSGMDVSQTSQQFTPANTFQKGNLNIQRSTHQNYSLRAQTEFAIENTNFLQQSLPSQQISQILINPQQYGGERLENHQQFNQSTQELRFQQQIYMGGEDSFSISSQNLHDTLIIEELLDQKKQDLAKQLSTIPDTDQIILWSKNKIQYAKSKRGSRYRGVSKNGKKWQVQLLGNMRKRYIGSISSEDQAAQIYDHYAIITHGLRAKTNFHYTKQEIQNIMNRFTESDILNPGKNIIKSCSSYTNN